MQAMTVQMVGHARNALLALLSPTQGSGPNAKVFQTDLYGLACALFFLATFNLKRRIDCLAVALDLSIRQHACRENIQCYLSGAKTVLQIQALPGEALVFWIAAATRASTARMEGHARPAALVHGRA